MFPNDTKQLQVKAYGTETSGTILTASTTANRTILWGTGNCSAGASDILASTTPVLSLTGTNSSAYSYMRYALPKNTGITYTKTSSGNCYYRILYTDYDLSKVTNTIPVTLVDNDNATSTFPYSYHDWLFISGVQIFFLSFIGISMLFSVLRKRK